MTIGLAVAMVACQAAAGKPGEPGEAGQPGAPGEPGGVPPSLDDAIGDQKLAASGAMASVDIDLDEHFYDPDGVEGETLTYVASSSDPEKVTATVTGSTLTLTAVAVGPAKITVRATDVDGLSSGSARFDVTVAETAPPQNTAIPDQTLYQADSPKTIALADHFMHTSTITYDVDTSPEGFVAATNADGVLTLTPRVVGQTIVTVTATADNRNTMDDFIVTVKAGSKPTPTTPDPDPPARNGSIMAQEVEVGKSTAAIDASEYFTPATGLTFTASSSAIDKATPAVSGSSLTITGVAVGSATVTVTATDAQNRSATQTIAVTVTAAGAIYKPSTVIIDGVTKMEDVSIDDGQTLQSLAIGTVTAAKKLGSDTVWTLTGEKKGTAMVRIWNADRTLDKTITVTVENTAPMKTKDAPVGRVLAMSIDGSQHVDKDGLTLADADVTSEKRQYHKINLDYAEFFEDPDAGDLGDDAYMADSNEPYIKVVEVLSSGVVIDVMKDVGSSFPLVVYVVDKAGAMSEKVTLTAPSPEPRADKYEVTQSAGDGDFSTATVYLREGVDHTLTFAAYGADGDASGFRFVSVFETEELPKTGVSVVDGTAVFVAPNPVPDASSSSVPYYTVSKTGPVELVEVSADNPKGLQISSDIPTLTFKVTGSGRATVTITYNVAVDLDGAGAGTAYGWKKDSETLTMNIVSSS